jgi:hypothetical protein
LGRSVPERRISAVGCSRSAWPERAAAKVVAIGRSSRGTYRRPNTERVLFAYAFAKNAASTLTPQGHEALARVADAFVAADDEQVAALLAAGDVREVGCDGEG